MNNTKTIGIMATLIMLLSGLVIPSVSANSGSQMSYNNITATNATIVPMVVGNGAYVWLSPKDPTGWGIRSNTPFSCVYYLGVFFGNPIYFTLNTNAC